MNGFHALCGLNMNDYLYMSCSELTVNLRLTKMKMSARKQAYKGPVI